MDDQVAALVALLPEAWGKPGHTPDGSDNVLDPIATIRFVNAPQQQATWIENLLAALGVAQVQAYTVEIAEREVTPRKKGAMSFPVATIKVWVAP